MSTESDEAEPDYGSWEFTIDGELKAEREKNPPQVPANIWPQWVEGVPTLLRHSGWIDSFYKGGVSYRSRMVTTTVELGWCTPRNLSQLRNNYRLLPRDWTSQWSGVYRVFVESETIDRLLGKDPTGTLYLGMAGEGQGKWSTLRTRIMDLANRRSHQLADRWSFSDELESAIRGSRFLSNGRARSVG